jgi:hypothetical protein
VVDQTKKPGSAWGDDLDDQAAAGVNKEMIRRALSMNPNLRQMTNTTDAMTALQAQKGAKPAAMGGKAAAPAIDLLAELATFEQAYRAEQQEIAQQQEQLTRRKQELTANMLRHVMETILEVDPNMVSPKTVEVMGRYKAFVDEIGFSTKKLVDFQQAAKRK